MLKPLAGDPEPVHLCCCFLYAPDGQFLRRQSPGERLSFFLASSSSLLVKKLTFQLFGVLKLPPELLKVQTFLPKGVQQMSFCMVQLYQAVDMALHRWSNFQWRCDGLLSAWATNTHSISLHAGEVDEGAVTVFKHPTSSQRQAAYPTVCS